MKKKTVLFASLAAIAAIFIFVLVLMVGSKERKLGQYGKYSLGISVDIKTENNVKSHLIDVSYDGENARVNSSMVNRDSYIIGERIYYLEDDTFYWYSVDKSYADVYDAISTLDKIDFVKDVASGKQYTTILKENTVNDILNSLFIMKKVEGSAKATIILDDGKIREFNIILSDLQGYDEVSINIVVSKLQDDYKVNISRIFGQYGGGRRYKTSEASTNAFEIID